jgi:hypothetical protein
MTKRWALGEHRHRTAVVCFDFGFFNSHEDIALVAFLLTLFKALHPNALNTP